MQSSRLLRAVDWFIDVPKDPAQFKNRSVYSTIFSIEYNNIVTKWGLSHNLNDRENDQLGVYVYSLSPDVVNFDCKLFFTIMSDLTSVSSKGIKDKNIWKSNSNFGRSSLIDCEKLRANYEFYCSSDGKLPLRTEIYLICAETLLENPKTNKRKSEFENYFENSAKTFSAMVAPDADSILIRTHDGMTFKAYKEILGEKSIVFKNMFSTNMEESANKIVEIIGFSGQIMQELLRFVYYGHVQNIESLNVELFKAANVYDIGVLPEICLDSITAGLTRDNVIDIVVFADIYGLNELFQSCCAKIHAFYQNSQTRDELDQLDLKLQNKVLKKITQISFVDTARITVSTLHGVGRWPLLVGKTERSDVQACI